jgi:hypothetical protein
MKPFDQPYFPGQTTAAWFKRASAIVALDGTLRLTYRDASLDWLLSDALRVELVLREGERHVLPYEAFVEISAIGSRAATARIVDLATTRNLFAWLGRFVPSFRRPSDSAHAET